MRLHGIDLLKAAALILGGVLLATPVSAQTSPQARLFVTVSDSSGGVLPTATITVTPATQGAVTPRARTAVTSKTGLAVLEALTPGTYAIQAEFTGFETRVLSNVRLQAGDNRHTLVLQSAAIRCGHLPSSLWV
ncbi:MAG TPA: carboxypeptidase-like regulatory domain-containing protein [Vicinamibacterales bacterium]|nr:carboxypeptidase-like regulatory domain-containing protein [Vicinamibacterales bacterium]